MMMPMLRRRHALPASETGILGAKMSAGLQGEGCWQTGPREGLTLWTGS